MGKKISVKSAYFAKTKEKLRCKRNLKRSRDHAASKGKWEKKMETDIIKEEVFSPTNPVKTKNRKITSPLKKPAKTR